MDAYLIDIHFRSGNICWLLFPPSDGDDKAAAAYYYNNNKKDQESKGKNVSAGIDPVLSCTNMPATDRVCYGGKRWKISLK